MGILTSGMPFVSVLRMMVVLLGLLVVCGEESLTGGTGESIESTEVFNGYGRGYKDVTAQHDGHKDKSNQIARLQHEDHQEMADQIARLQRQVGNLQRENTQLRGLEVDVGQSAEEGRGGMANKAANSKATQAAALKANTKARNAKKETAVAIAKRNAQRRAKRNARRRAKRNARRRAKRN